MRELDGKIFGSRSCRMDRAPWPGANDFPVQPFLTQSISVLSYGLLKLFMSLKMKKFVYKKSTNLHRNWSNVLFNLYLFSGWKITWHDLMGQNPLELYHSSCQFPNTTIQLFFRSCSREGVRPSHRDFLNISTRKVCGYKMGRMMKIYILSLLLMDKWNLISHQCCSGAIL